MAVEEVSPSGTEKSARTFQHVPSEIGAYEVRGREEGRGPFHPLSHIRPLPAWLLVAPPPHTLLTDQAEESGVDLVWYPP